MKCPACGHENISGVDACEECLQPLVDLEAATERSHGQSQILASPVDSLHPAVPISVEADQSLSETLRLMDKQGIGCLLVMHEGRLVGIFTERDAVMKVGTDIAASANAPIRDFMTPDPETIDAGASVAFALHKMDLGGYRHLPVMNDHSQPTGIISVRDILRYLTEEHATAGG